MENETWVPVPLEDAYSVIFSVSDMGRIKSHRLDKILQPGKNSRGYYTVSLREKDMKGRKNFTVHRLVAIAFIPNPLNLKYINHKDSNKANNAKSNLEWCTARDNMLHSWSSGLRKSRRTNLQLTNDIDSQQ